MKKKLLNLWSRFKAWWTSLPKWKKITIILTVLVVLGLLTWWLISITTATTGIHGAGSIYVMNDGIATKIGLTSREVAVRAAEIAQYAPGTEVIGSINVSNMLAVENMAHSHFSAHNITTYLGSREWFDIPANTAMKYLYSIT